ncbi:unnamed protein product [Mytilus coruscus]|uniref:Uncharacterized protein n=1 Tax=Mytilus coruscus TaxID=42192 RepID=A0A6J8E4C3_MYTCO|nr:unnamed protein product [Mytilus coruscus]
MDRYISKALPLLNASHSSSTHMSRNSKTAMIATSVSNHDSLKSVFHCIRYIHHNSSQLAQQNFEEKVVVATNTQGVLSYPPRDYVSSLPPCSHEEAYTRNMVHVSDAVKHGLKRVMIRTVNTEVAVIAVLLFRDIWVDELWLAFGSGKCFS